MAYVQKSPRKVAKRGAPQEPPHGYITLYTDKGPVHYQRVDDRKKPKQEKMQKMPMAEMGMAKAMGMLMGGKRRRRVWFGEEQKRKE